MCFVFCTLVNHSLEVQIIPRMNTYIHVLLSFSFSFPFYFKQQQFISNMALSLFHQLLTTYNQSNYTFKRLHFA